MGSAMGIVSSSCTIGTSDTGVIFACSNKSPRSGLLLASGAMGSGSAGGTIGAAGIGSATGVSTGVTTETGTSTIGGTVSGATGEVGTACHCSSSSILSSLTAGTGLLWSAKIGRLSGMVKGGRSMMISSLVSSVTASVS